MLMKIQILSSAVMVIGFIRNVIIILESDMLASLTVRILSGALAPDAWAVVEFTTSDKPFSNTSAVCKSVTVAFMQEFVNISFYS